MLVNQTSLRFNGVFRMTRFLFWNVNKKPMADLIALAMRQYDIDMLILAECDVSVGRMLTSLNKEEHGFFHIKSYCDRITIYSRYSSNFVKALWEDARTTMQEVTLPQRMSFLLVATHLPSRRYWDETELALETARISKVIRGREESLGHRRTVVVGDFNMDPFETGVLASHSLHGVMTRDLALEKERTVNGEIYPFFYNPMWSCFGDRSPGPPGTFFYKSTSPNSQYWHLFDQVLIRPELLSCLPPEGVQILDKVGRMSLVDERGRPDRKLVSDHLPILFELDL